jgi:hypothetical protein
MKAIIIIILKDLKLTADHDSVMYTNKKGILMSQI